MADLLFSGFGVMPVARRKERRFRLPNNFSISDYTDDELRSRYRFGRNSIAFSVDLLRPVARGVHEVRSNFPPHMPQRSTLLVLKVQHLECSRLK